jgi:hypothetical protein
VKRGWSQVDHGLIIFTDESIQKEAAHRILGPVSQIRHVTSHESETPAHPIPTLFSFHCSKFLVHSPYNIPFPSATPFSTSPQDAPHRWNTRSPSRSIHPRQMDLDRPLYFTASQATDAAGRRGDSRPSKYHHGVRFIPFVLERVLKNGSSLSVAHIIPKWTAALGKTFRTQTFCGVRSPPPLLPISRILTPPPTSYHTNYGQ